MDKDYSKLSSEGINCENSLNEDIYVNNLNSISIATDQIKDSSLNIELSSKIANIDSLFKPKVRSITIIKTKSKLKTEEFIKVKKEIKINLQENSDFTYDKKIKSYRRKTYDEKILSKMNYCNDENDNNATLKQTNSIVKSKLENPLLRVTFSSIRVEYLFSESDNGESSENDSEYIGSNRTI